ncbi:MAG: deoxyribonuclease IV [Deltaproteobacteria bacterium]
METGEVTTGLKRQKRSPGKTGLLLGGHMSIAGGVHRALERGHDLGCTAIQIFTKNATRWKAGSLTPDEVSLFKKERQRTGILVVAHDSYLINLASPDPELLEKSVAAFRDEMERAEQLEIPFLVMHPGAHKGRGEGEGIRSVTRAFNRLLKETTGFQVHIVVENTAGQGTALGHSFEQLSRMIADTVEPERMGICLDTCHAFAAGYDVRDQMGYTGAMEEFDCLVGLDRLKVLHLNDCKKGLGSRVDRHEHIGRGMIGLECFHLIMNDSRLGKVPKFLETPKYLGGRDMDPVNLELLRGMVGATRGRIKRVRE